MSESEPGIAPLPTPVQRGPAYPFLVATVILLGVLIVIALGVLLVGLFMHLGGSSRSSSSSVQFQLAHDARIVSAEVSGDRLVLRLNGSFGDEVDIIDLQTGSLVARFRSAAPPKKP